MPVSDERSRLLHAGLKASGVRLLAAMPERWLLPLLEMAAADPEMTLVEVAREEEAVGIAAGAHLAGVGAAVVMQNHGLLASVNAIVSLALLYRIPLVMLVSYRGHLGERDPWQTEGGLVTEPLLAALGIPAWPLRPPDDIGRRLADARALAESALRPVAVLLTRDLMWEGG